MAMQKTTVYLPDDLKAAVAREARRRSRDPNRAEACSPAPSPSRRATDEPLVGFGER
jgi:hypothetical protein